MSHNRPPAQPDLSSRPLKMSVERLMAAPPHVLYRAFTEQWDRWFAEAGTVLMRPEPNTVFYMETHHGGEVAPYYGRFLRLEEDRVVEFTWVAPGTEGVETVISVEFQPRELGTLLKLTHAGFPSQESKRDHIQVWPEVLKGMDEVFPGI